MAGLTETGLVIPTVNEIRESINQSIRGVAGAKVNLTDSTLIGQMVGIFSERIHKLWELAEAVHSSMNPDAATGEALVALAALTGTLQQGAESSSVVLTLTGTPGTPVTQGSRARIPEGEEFETEADTTIDAATAWSASTAYAVSDRVTNNARVYECVTSGVSDAAGGPTTAEEDIADNTVVWRYLGEGTGAADVDSLSVNTGPIIAVSGSITEITTPVAGWTSVVNLLDATPGQDQDTDAELRTRRELELSAAGVGIVDGIRAGLLDVEGVTAVRVFVNNTDTTDADGVPPHAVECLVQGGEDQDIWDVLVDLVGAGIQTHGTEEGTAEDDEGVSHTMKFSRPVEVPVYIAVDVLKNAEEYPADGDDQIKQAIVERGDAGTTGLDTVAARISSWVFGVSGVLDVPSLFIGTAPAPATSATIPISLRELAVYDTSRITVTSSDGTP